MSIFVHGSKEHNDLVNMLNGQVPMFIMEPYLPNDKVWAFKEYIPYVFVGITVFKLIKDWQWCPACCDMYPMTSFKKTSVNDEVCDHCLNSVRG